MRLHRPRAAEAAAAGGDSSGDMDVEGAEVEGAAQPAKRLTWARLEAAVQCSSGAELQAALLQRARALEVGGGRWCILEAQYAQDVCGSLLDLLVEKEWPLDALPLGEAVEAMCPTPYDELAVRHCARALSTSRLSGWAEWGGALRQETLSLDVEAMCRFRAHGSW